MQLTAADGASPRRSAGLDLVRVVAIVAIVVSHAWGDERLRTVVHPWHVPVFFVLSGYLWRSGRPLADEVGRRTRTLLVPYAAWLLVLLGVVVVAALVRGDGPPLGSVRDALLGGAYAGRPFSAFWFVTALFVAVVLYRLLDRGPQVVRWAGALLGLAAGYVAPDLLAAVPLSVGLALPSLVLVAAGHELARRRPLLRPRAVLPVGILLVAAGALAVATGWSAPVDLKQSDLGTPVVSMVVAIVLSAGLVLVGESVASVLPPAATRGVLALAAAGLMVVLTHALVLWLLATPPAGRAVDALLALVVPWGVGLVLLRYPVAARVLLGGAAARSPRTGTPR